LEDDEENSSEAVKTIPLRSGELTLSGTFNAFELDTEERKLVYEIIDLMKQHEEKNKKSET
jgi:hypothetical protein